MNRAQRKTHRVVFTLLAPLLIGLVIYAWVSRQDPHELSATAPHEATP